MMMYDIVVTKQRCKWVSSDPIYIHYHDTEWGRPVYDERVLFEMLCLEGAVAGLSWLTILKKRDNYREAFAYFDASIMAHYDDAMVEVLMQNSGIIRHRGKISAFIHNAQAYLKMKEQGINFADFLWGFVNHTPIKNNILDYTSIPTKSTISDEMSKALKKYGFKFVGSTTCYAFMQAVGMVNDHEINCSHRD